MKAYIVPERTQCYLVLWRRQQYPELRKLSLVERHLFVNEDLRIDPDGISPHASGPRGVTIGADMARKGYFGFRCDANAGVIEGAIRLGESYPMLLVPAQAVSIY